MSPPVSVCDPEEKAEDLARVNENPPTARCYQPCMIEAWNDWENLRVPLTGNGVSGNFKNVFVELSSEEWEAVHKASQLADLVLSSNVLLGSGRTGRDVALTYTIDNNGPDAAFGVALNLRLPDGVELVRCNAPGGRCFPVGSVVAAGFDLIASPRARRQP